MKETGDDHTNDHEEEEADHNDADDAASSVALIHGFIGVQ